MRSIPTMAFALLIIVCLAIPTSADDPKATTVASQDIWEKLDEKAELQFDGTPLNEAIKIISERYGLNIVIDQASLDEEGIAPDEALAFNVKNVKLMTAIDLMLKQSLTSVELELVVIEDENYQLLTTQSAAEEFVVTKVYTLQELITDDDISGLISVIENSVGPMSWEAVGGYGTIQEFRSALVIRQTPAFHREIKLLLEELTTLPKVDPTVSFNHFDTNELYTKLKEETELQFVDTPLIDAINIIGKSHDIKFLMEQELKEDKEYSHYPVNIFVSGITVQSGLDLVLNSARLGYYIKDNLIVVTTAEKAAKVITQETYSVNHLGQDPEELAKLISSVIDTDSWEERGGSGVIRTSEGQLVVSQNLRNHLQIQSLLQKLKSNQPRSNEEFFGIDDPEVKTRTNQYGGGVGYF